MGIIFLDLGKSIQILAVGGKYRLFIYFRKALTELYTLARMLNAKLHVCFFDKAAWEQFRQDDIGYLSRNVLPSSRCIST